MLILRGLTHRLTQPVPKGHLVINMTDVSGPPTRLHTGGTGPDISRDVGDLTSLGLCESTYRKRTRGGAFWRVISKVPVPSVQRRWVRCTVTPSRERPESLAPSVDPQVGRCWSSQNPQRGALDGQEERFLNSPPRGLLTGCPQPLVDATYVVGGKETRLTCSDTFTKASKRSQ